MKRTMPRREVLPAGYCWQRRALVGGDSGTKRGSLAPGCARATGRHLGPTGVWSTARLDSTAAKVGKVPRVAEALPHSEGAAYNRPGREVAACPWDWRMGSEEARRGRDNRTRAGAKDPWGREVSLSHNRTRKPWTD